jgi:hypothetical protein
LLEPVVRCIGPNVVEGLFASDATDKPQAFLSRAESTVFDHPRLFWQVIGSAGGPVSPSLALLFCFSSF